MTYLSYGGHMDSYDVVKKYLDNILINVMNEVLLKLVIISTPGVSHSMQNAANMDVF